MTNIRRVNPRETPKKNTYIIKLGTNIYNSDVTGKPGIPDTGVALPGDERLDKICADKEAEGEAPV